MNQSNLEKKASAINKFLKENYGLTIDANTTLQKLEQAGQECSQKLHEMKIAGKTPKDTAYARLSMMVEAIEIEIERRNLQEQQNLAYSKVIGWLVNYATKLMNIGDSFQEAVSAAMKEYRSSKYRFNDSDVQRDTEKSLGEVMGVDTMSSLFDSAIAENVCNWLAGNEQLHESVATIHGGLVQEDLQKLFVYETYGHILKNLVDESVWDTIDKKQQDAAERLLKSRGSKLSMLGDNPFAPDATEYESEPHDAQQKRAAEWLKNKDSLLTVIDEPPVGVPRQMKAGPGDKGMFNRDKDDAKSLSINHNTIKAPLFYGKRPGVFSTESVDIKEGYVATLRKLLESEVEEAEVLIAAKGFGSALQTIVEKLGRLQNEELTPVVDQMRETYGMHVSQSFSDLMTHSMTEIMNMLRDTKEQIDTMVTDIATGNMSGNDLGNKRSRDEFAGNELDLGGVDVSDDLAPIDMPIEDEALGRVQKESRIASLQKQLVETQQKLQKLAEARKAKKK